MDWSILFMGPVGAGKTKAIRTLSDIEVAGTEASATDETTRLKPLTTVAMDVGVLDLGAGDKVRLIGAPGQARFDFMWDILLEQAKAAIILVDHSRASCLTDLEYFVRQLTIRLGRRSVPLAVGVTHVDESPTGSLSGSLSEYSACLRRLQPSFVRGVVPVMQVDTRVYDDVRALVLSVAAMLEMEHRFGHR